MMASKQWEAWEAYTVGDRKSVGIMSLRVEQEVLNNGGTREYISMIGGDGNHFIFRPGHPAYDYEEIKRVASTEKYVAEAKNWH